MKATNWLHVHVRHTRPGNRKIHDGSVEASWNGIMLKKHGNASKYLEIHLSDEEVINLIAQLSKIQILKEKEKIH